MARFLHESNLTSAIKVIKDYEKESDAKFAVTVQQNYCQQGEFGMPPHDVEEVLRHKVMFEELPLNGIPHVMLGLKKFTCQHGPKRKCDIKKSKMSQSEDSEAGKKSANSKKFGCTSVILMHSVWVFPEFKIPSDTLWHRRETSKKIKNQLEQKELMGEHRIYVNLPDPKAHSNHLSEQALEWKDWKKDVKERKKKKREEKLIQLAEQQMQEKEEMLSNEKEENELAENGRPWTLSIALPGSILDNAQSPELRTYLAGQIARALVIFNIDEIIIFDESGAAARENTDGVYSGIGKKGNANVQLARILQYLECPQYLRKSFFPKHNDLQYAGLLNPLDCPHHVRADEEIAYREGVVVDRPVAKGRGSHVNVGLYKEVEIDKKLQAQLRVTVKMNTKKGISPKHAPCKVVSPSAPRLEAGLYWGYSVRLASSLGAVFTGCPFSDNGYDLTIGTSERGTKADDVDLPHFKHALIIFGGVHGLELSLETDEELLVSDPAVLFDHYINVCPDQGSRTIRTEEAVLITMATLRPKILSAQDWNR
ncbi:putative methyltransferase C9orf114 [Strongylocentrotus purpuratus]|uniref:28S rRNA (uridine-N(3))-methyltransferase n=1 Tax=Strongylocentrotus purpuratus TaxID=7668 RepID=A0A7M7HLP5_STRPU|nr:putative methyltransferase C9orf114 [Strongylocentrotus purpuratus]